VELTNWQQLSDHGPDLVLCLDFPGGRAASGFTDLVAEIAVDACFLHIGPIGPDPTIDQWAAQVLATGRPVRAVLGYCAGTTLATGIANAVAAAGPPPIVLLFDAVVTTGGALCDQFVMAAESSAEYLTADELDGARRLADELLESYPDDLPRLAAGLIERYDQLTGAVVERLSLNDFVHQELTRGFTAYLQYLLLASQGGFELRGGTPVFLSSTGHQPPVDGARVISLDVDREDLLRDPEVHKIVAGLLRGERLW
jgi:hypothetical protein